MFDNIAGVYDRMNRAMTAGLDRRWRALAVDRAALAPGDRVLDVATGTGDLAIALRERVGPSGEVVGTDFAERMLERARTKAPAIRFERANALDLPYADSTFDAATVAFGARNFSDLARGLEEMHRVVRPGGRVVVLEITTPRRPPLSWFFRAWFDSIVPALGRLAGDAEAYAYLPSSVRRFPGPEGLAQAMARAGFGEIKWVLTGGGIIAVHSGVVGRKRPVSLPGDTGSAPALAQLKPVLAAGGPELLRLLARTEERLAAAVGEHGEVLARYAGDTLQAGGKRLRPTLLFLCARRSEDERAERAAVAVELLHMATLVHDDVLDGAELRRGRPTIYRSSGRAAATATGDLLFSRAFAELARTGSREAVRALSSASSGLVRGELLQREDAWSHAVTLERYLERCELKTARLFEASCRLGALLGSAAPDAADALGSFGGQIGIAFQIFDDVLDVSGPVERTGKARGADLMDGTVTLPLILARRRDPVLARLDLRAEAADPERVEQLCERIVATGALVEAREQAMDRVTAAKATLAELDLELDQRHALKLVAEGVVERYS